MQRKNLTSMWLGILLVLCLTRPAAAETLFGDLLKEKGVDLEVTASIDYYDKYVWRGFTLDKDNVMQPALTVTSGGFQGGFWGSWDLESKDALASDEVDGWVGYHHDLGFINEALEVVDVKFGHTWYAFPEAGTHTEEFYVGLSLATLLSPYFTAYLDYGDEAHGGADGQYYMFGISHSFTLNEKYGIALNLGQEIGLNNDAFIIGEGGYSLTTASLTVPLSENVTLTPKIAYSTPWDDLEDDTANGGINVQEDRFYGGMSLAFAF